MSPGLSPCSYAHWQLYAVTNTGLYVAGFLCYRGICSDYTYWHRAVFEGWVSVLFPCMNGRYIENNNRNRTNTTLYDCRTLQNGNTRPRAQDILIYQFECFILNVQKLSSQHWRWIVMMLTSSSLAEWEVVITRSSGAASDNKVGIMTTFWFRLTCRQIAHYLCGHGSDMSYAE